jgi:hypothetical protein
MRIILKLTASIFVAGVLITSVQGVGPLFWRVNTRAEVERGDAVGVSIADNGTISLAPALTEVFDTKQAYIWSAVSDAAGNVYLGTGHEGRIFKVDAQGKGSLLLKTAELDVMALTLDASGNLYAGTAPDGKVYRIRSNGTSEVFFEPKTKYIWSLAFDKQGRLLVGTGDKGVIYRVNADGSSSIFANTTQTNITAIRIDASGNAIVGTDPGGLVLRVSPEGKVFTLFDSSQREVRDIALGARGEIFALTLSESAGAGASNSAPAAAAPAAQSASEDGVSVTISDVQLIDSGGAAAVAASGTSGSSSSTAKSVLYRIDATGVSESLWESKDAAAFALGLVSDGGALVGTGQKGRIYRVLPGQKPTLLAQPTEAQTARFVVAGDRLYFASSNLGKLFRMGKDLAASGSYTSSVRDAQTVASWGRVSWSGEGNIEIQTRSGNTAVPDLTWSDWSPAVRTPEGAAIQSPPARFIQWRAALSAGGVAPRLREVTVAYLPRNLTPRVTSISVLPVGVALIAVPQPQSDLGAEQAGLDPQTLGNVAVIPPRRAFQKGAISLQWQAEDRNGDSLEFTLNYRSASKGDYHPLKSGLKDAYFTIEPNALPDGEYVFQIVASDVPSNPRPLALQDDLETEPIEIDNTPPAVIAGAPTIAAGAAAVEFKATDATSLVRRAEYQLDGGEWLAVFPVDGIADSRSEVFRVSVNLTDSRPHVLAFRAFDGNANVGIAKVEVLSSAR